jgi:hypothetical protein
MIIQFDAIILSFLIAVLPGFDHSLIPGEIDVKCWPKKVTDGLHHQRNSWRHSGVRNPTTQNASDVSILRTNICNVCSLAWDTLSLKSREYMNLTSMSRCSGELIWFRTVLIGIFCSVCDDIPGLVSIRTSSLNKIDSVETTNARTRLPRNSNCKRRFSTPTYLALRKRRAYRVARS